eukprot:4117993-Amphidinium_carterae.1
MVGPVLGERDAVKRSCRLGRTSKPLSTHQRNWIGRSSLKGTRLSGSRRACAALCVAKVRRTSQVGRGGLTLGSFAVFPNAVVVVLGGF